MLPVVVLGNKTPFGAACALSTNSVVALKAPWEDAGLPVFEGRDEVDGKPTAYVCRNRACQLPTSDPRVLAGQLDASSSS